VPAAAVIPALRANVKVAAVKKSIADFIGLEGERSSAMLILANYPNKF